MWVWVYAHECRHLWGPALSDTQDLELQVILSCTMWVLGSEFWSSAKAARVLKFWAIPLVLIRSLLAERPTLTVSGTIPGLWFIDWFKRRKAVDCGHYDLLLPGCGCSVTTSLKLPLPSLLWWTSPPGINRQWDKSLTDILNSFVAMV